VHGERRIDLLAVSAAPCGHCRQFYAELEGAGDVGFLFGGGADAPRFLGELLPERFGPHDLEEEDFPLLLQPHNNLVRFSTPALRKIEQRSDDAALQAAASEALRTAVAAYSPYTHCPSGCAVITSAGRVYAGGSIESAAYNPSLSPFHTACIHGVTQGLGSFDEIKEIVVAELQGARVRHAANVRLLQRSVAPKAKLTVLPLRYGRPR